MGQRHRALRRGREPETSVTTKTYGRIVSPLYEAVLDDRLWPRICDLVGAGTDVHGIHLVIVDEASVDPNLVFSHCWRWVRRKRFAMLIT